MKELIPVEMIERKILPIRCEKVMLDADLPHSMGLRRKGLMNR